jgi:hypothetical protein
MRLVGGHADGVGRFAALDLANRRSIASPKSAQLLLTILRGSRQYSKEPNVARRRSGRFRWAELVWLDYERPVMMARVISRTFLRTVLRTELWAGNREQWRHLLRPSHPIRWAWNTWDRRRRETAERLTQREYAHLVVLRLRRPTEVRRAFGLLAGAAGVHISHDGAARRD